MEFKVLSFGEQRAPRSVDEFVDQYGPALQSIGERIGVSPRVLAAQFGLETAWGKAVIPGTNNLGNIKDFSGGGVPATDNMTGSRDRYRAYDSQERFADDYVNLITKRYPNAIGAGDDPVKFASALKAGGYAEDPAYVQKIASAYGMVPDTPSDGFKLLSFGDGPRQQPQSKPAQYVGYDDYVKQARAKNPSINEGEVAQTWMDTYGQMEAPKPTSLWTDIKNTFSMGFQGLALDAREIARRVIGDDAVAVIDRADEFWHGKSSEKLIKDNIEKANQALSPEMREALKKEWWDDKADTFGEAWSDPRTYLGGLMQSAPGTLITMVPGLGMARGIYAAGAQAASKAATKEAAQLIMKEAAARAATTAAIAGGTLEGLQQAGQTGREVREAILGMDQAKLADSEALKSLMSGGLDFEAARAKLAEDASAQAMTLAGVATGVFGGMGDRVLARAFTKGLSGNLATRIAKGAAAEGLLEEAPQSYLSKVSENIGMQQAVPSTPTTKGALNEALGGAVLGGLMGGGMAALSRRQEDQPQTTPQPTPQPAPTVADGVANTMRAQTVEEAVQAASEAALAPLPEAVTRVRAELDNLPAQREPMMGTADEAIRRVADQVNPSMTGNRAFEPGSVDEAIQRARREIDPDIGRAAGLARLPEITSGPLTQEQALWMQNRQAIENTRQNREVQAQAEIEAQKQADYERLVRESRLPAAEFDVRRDQQTGAAAVAEAPNAMQLAMQRAQERAAQRVLASDSSPLQPIPADAQGVTGPEQKTTTNQLLNGGAAENTAPLGPSENTQQKQPVTENANQNQVIPGVVDAAPANQRPAEIREPKSVAGRPVADIPTEELRQIAADPGTPAITSHAANAALAARQAEAPQGAANDRLPNTNVDVPAAAPDAGVRMADGGRSGIADAGSAIAGNRSEGATGPVAGGNDALTIAPQTPSPDGVSTSAELRPEPKIGGALVSRMPRSTLNAMAKSRDKRLSARAKDGLKWLDEKRLFDIAQREAEAAQREENKRIDREAREAAARLKDTPSRDVFRLVRDYGGINKQYANDVAGDRGVRGLGAWARVFREPERNAAGVIAKGHGLDEIANELQRQGYMTQEELEDNGPQIASDIIRNAIAGTLEPITEAQIIKAREQEARSRAEREEAEAALRAGDVPATPANVQSVMTVSEALAIIPVSEHAMLDARAETMTNDAWESFVVDYAQGIQNERDRRIQEADRGSQETGGEETPAQTGGTGQGQEAALELTQQTPDDLAAANEKAKADEARARSEAAAKAAAEKAETERKAIADASAKAADEFTLTPTSAVDKATQKAEDARVAEAQLSGQRDIFASPPTVEDKLTKAIEQQTKVLSDALAALAGNGEAKAGAQVRRGEVGMMLESGEVVLTATGRKTTPFPKVKVGTNRATGATVKAVDKWLIENAIAEAESRGDEFNARTFRADAGNLQQAGKDAAEEYLFGGDQPPVLKPALRPLVNTTAPQDGAAEPEQPKEIPHVKRGDQFKDGAGKTWEVWSTRHDHIEAFPVIDGKMRVSNSTSEFWALRPEAQARYPNARTDFNPIKRPGMKGPTPQIASPAMLKTFIGIAADSIEKLRKVDVERVLTSNPRIYQRHLASYIQEKRPDLAQEVDDVLAEQDSNATAPQDGTAAQENANKNNDVEKSTFGKKNTVFTEDKANAARELLRRRLSGGTLSANAPLDPEVIKAGIDLTGYYIEGGARRFTEFAAKMIADLGESVRPYLKSWYMAVKFYPGFDSAGMDNERQVERAAANLALAKNQADNGNLENANAASAITGMEQDSRTGETEIPVGEETVFDEPGRDDQGAGPASPLVGEARVSGESDSRVPANGAAAGGASGDQPVHRDNGEYSATPGNAGSDVGGRSADLFSEGVGADSTGTGEALRASPKTSELSNSRARQKLAQAVRVIPGDPENIKASLPILLDGQRDDVKFAEDRFAKPDGHGVLFTNGTGTGKTFTGLGVVKRFERQGKDNILIVAPTDTVLNAWIEAGRDFSLDIKLLDGTSSNGRNGIVATTYANFGANNSLAERTWDLVVADEAHYLSANEAGETTNALKKLRALTGHPDGFYTWFDGKEPALIAEMNAANEAGRFGATPIPRALVDRYNKAVEARRAEYATLTRGKALFLSATPFAYVPSVRWAEGYLFEYPKVENSSAYNHAGGEERFFIQHFGYRMRYGKLTQPDAKVDSGLMEVQFNEFLKNQGALSSRVLDVDKDYDRKFVLVDGGIGRQIDEGMDWLYNAEDGRYRELAEKVRKNFDYLSRAFLLEAIKARGVVPMIKEHLALGRKVVVFHDYNKGGGFNPFDIRDDGSTISVGRYPNQKEMLLRDVLAEFKQKRPDLLKLPFASYASPIETLSRAFPNALFINGTVPKKERMNAKNAFNSDTSGRNLIVAQSDAAREGVSLHDTTGKHQRILFNLGMPIKPTAAIQIEGRTYRIGQKSDALFNYMNTGTVFERYTFASKISERAGTAENLALGGEARALKESFIEAFENSSEHEAVEGQGKGGKLRDRASRRLISEFDKAKTYYFGQQKKTSRNKAAEGVDYFATPEPLAFKMVEWANVRPDDVLLEPSAGHGAIARFFPKLNTAKMIEPSGELGTRAMLVSGADLVQERFENFHIVNKADVIVMNPPFGVGGKTAMDHLAKAMTHLNDGGRIVALIPRGSMADKRFEQLMYPESDKARKDSPAKDVYLAAEILLPSVTFERAGASVSARIVVLEKQTDEKAAQRIQQVTRDYSDAEDINAFFDRIENGTVPERQEIPKPAENAASGVTIAEQAPPSGSYKLSTKVSAKGKTWYLANPTARVSSDEFSAIREQADGYGGWWARMWKGFAFPDEASRQKFIDGKPDTDAKFSRQGISGLSNRDAHAVYDRISPLYKNLPPVTILNRPAELPDRVRDLYNQIKSAGGLTDVEAAFYDGEIFAFTDNIKDEARFEHVLFNHELTHYGLRGVLGAKFDPTMNMLFAKNKALREMAVEKRKVLGLDSNVAAVEEVLADMTPDELVKLKGIDRLLSMLRDWLAKHGFNKLAETMDGLLTKRIGEDMASAVLVSDIVRAAREFARNGKPDNKSAMFMGGTAFAQTDSAISDTLEIDGQQRPTRNSKGQLLAQTEEGIRNFWRWFGDSKVVDADGRPLVVYRGMMEEIKNNRFRVTEGGTYGPGVYFSTDPQVASFWAGNMEEDGIPNEYGGSVYPSYVSIKNPASGGEASDVEASFGGGARDELMRRNYDGVIVDDGEILAFSPEQIKSATGNSGQFSPTNPDIRFSRVPPGSLAQTLDTLKSNAAQNGRLDTIRELFDNAGKFGMLKNLQTQFHKASKDKRFKRVFNAVNDQINDTSRYAIEAEAEAPSILQRMETAGDVLKTLQQGNAAAQADLKAVSQAVFANIEGEQGVQQKVFTDAELKDQFDLTPKQIEMYREFRDAVDTSLDRLAQTMMMKVAGGYVDTRAMKGMSMADTADEIDAMLRIKQEQIQDRLDALDDELRTAEANRQISATIDEFGRQQYRSIKEKTPTAEGLEKQIADIDDVRDKIKEMSDYTSELKAKGYAPAMRFGRFAVTVRQGERVEFFSMYETQQEANIAMMNLRREYPGMTITKDVMNPDQWKMFQGVSPETVELFAKFMGADETDAFKAYASLAASSRSALKRMLERKGVAGFSWDAQRVLAQFVTSNARQAAINVNSREVNDALQDAHKSGGDVEQEAQKLVGYVRNPEEEAAGLRGLLFMHYLGGSMASAITNMTQPVMMTAPYLHQFAGNSVAGVIGRAMKMATTGKVTDDGLRAALQKADEEGITKPHEIHMLMAEAASGPMDRFPRWQAFKKAWGGFFALSEAFNRKTTFLAAYDIAQGMPDLKDRTGFNNAYDFAKNAVTETQGLYNKANRPNWARGPVMATIFTFKQFSIAYLEMLSRLPRKQQLLALGLLVLAAGAEGLPFADDLEDLIDTIGQKLGYATNSKKAVRNFMADIMGDGMAEYALHGVSALPGMPIDVAGRLGMSNLIPGTALFNPSRQNKANEVLEVFGAAGGLAKGAMSGFDAGKPREAMPTAIKNAMMGLEMWNTGEYRDAKGRKVTDADGVDAVVKGLIGFQPAHIAADTRRLIAAKRDVDIAKHFESEIADAWAQGILERDNEKVMAARERLRQWNEDNPEMPIRIGMSQISRRVKEAKSSRDARFLKTAPPEIRRSMMMELTQ